MTKLLVSLLFAACIFLVPQSAFTQLLTFDFAGLAGSETSANSNGNNANITGSTITRGSGLTASGNGDRFNATNWALTSINNAVSGNNYMQFAVTPNGGCSVSITSVYVQLQRSGTGPSAIALRSSADGFTTNLDQIYNIVDNTSTQNFTFTFSITSSTPVTFRIYMYAEATGGSGGIGDGAGNDLIVNGTTSCGSSNTITTGATSGAPYSVNCNGTTASGSVAFTSSGTFTAGNVYSVQLSDASGSFAAPTTIGTLSSTATSGSINYTIPAGTASGTGYRVRVVASNPSTIGTNSSTFTVTQNGTCAGPHITSVLTNSCSPSGCAEGHNEIIFGNTGSTGVTVTPANFAITYGNSPSPSTNYTNSLTTNPTTTAALNTAAGCPGTFVEGTGAILPANASFIVVRSTLCSDALDWSGLCSSGPIYVIYSTDSDWQTSGNFVNSASGMRYFESIITGTNATTYDYNYDWNSNLSALHDDGDYVNFPPTGGSATVYGNNGCAIDPIVLSAEVIHFQANWKGRSALVSWDVLSQTQNDYYQVDRSEDGTSWQLIERVKGSGTEAVSRSYAVTDPSPAQGTAYYKLTTVDLDGKRRMSGIALLKHTDIDVQFDQATALLQFGKAGNYGIYTTDGRKVAQLENGRQIYFPEHGLFIIHDEVNGITTKLVLP